MSWTYQTTQVAGSIVLALYVIERELVWAGVNELAKLFLAAGLVEFLLVGLLV